MLKTGYNDTIKRQIYLGCERQAIKRIKTEEADNEEISGFDIRRNKTGI